MPKQTSKERAHVLRLSARNVKTIRQVDITFDGTIHEIAGDTGQGKTTLLEAIEGGLRGLDPGMVRQGSDQAEIVLELTNAKIQRLISGEGKDTLFVTQPNGEPVAKAKEFLKAIFSPLTFRPIAWVQRSGGDAKGKTERLRAQRDELLAALDVKLTLPELGRALWEDLGDAGPEALTKVNLAQVDMDAHGFAVAKEFERTTYDLRRTINARLEEAKNRLDLVPAPDRRAPCVDAEEVEKGLEAAQEAYHRARAWHDGRQAMSKRREALQRDIDEAAQFLPNREKFEKAKVAYQAAVCAGEKVAYQAAVCAGEAEVEHLRERLRVAEAKLRENRNALDQWEKVGRKVVRQDARIADLAEIEKELGGADAVPDVEGLRNRVEELKADLAAQKAQDLHDEAAAVAETARRESETFTDLVEWFRDTLPKRLLEKADLPVEGLGVDGDCVTLHGVPIHQLGTSEQIRLAVLVAHRLTPAVGFVCVDGAESLGRKDLAALAQAAAELDLQIIMTKVDPDAEPGPGRTVMRGGAAVADRATTEQKEEP